MTMPLDLLVPFLVGSVLVTVVPVYLGVHALLASRKPPADAHPAAVAAPRRAFLQGLISTVLNPKPALLPHVPAAVRRPRRRSAPTDPHLGRHPRVVGLIWRSTYARLVHRAHGLLTVRRVKSWLERTTGAVSIAFGLRVAIERR
jgi:threonine/homoserine/homoserine lactone efflux protein